VLAHGLIFGQVFINAAKGIPTAQPSKMLMNEYKPRAYIRRFTLFICPT
jgi:hypothetical protein